MLFSQLTMSSLRNVRSLVIAGTSSVRGLVRTSELSWNPVRNPRDICEIGQSVRVKILQLDK